MQVYASPTPVDEIYMQIDFLIPYFTASYIEKLLHNIKNLFLARKQCFFLEKLFFKLMFGRVAWIKCLQQTGR